MLRVCPSDLKQELEFLYHPHKRCVAYVQRPTKGAYEIPRNPSERGTLKIL